MAGSGRRFALEALFLGGLAVAVGLAGLSTGRIIGVMALGLLLTVLIELVSWRLAVSHPTGVAVAEAPPRLLARAGGARGRRTRAAAASRTPVPKPVRRRRGRA